MSKKIWAVISLLVIMAMVLAACGGTATEAPAVEEPAAEAPAAEEPAAEEPMAEEPMAEGVCASGQTYTITLWNQWDGKYLEPITAAFNDYMAKNPCVTIDLSKPDDVQAALQTAMPAGQGPDIIAWANDRIGDLSLLGFVADLTTLGVDKAYLDSNYEPAAVNGVILGDAIYALPETQEGIALVANNAVVTDEYKITDPNNFDDLYAKAEAFKAATGNPLVCNQGFGGSDAYHNAPVYFGYGVPSYVDDQGNAFMNTPEALEAATWLQTFAGVSNAESSYDICNAAIQEGKTGYWWTGPWAIAGLIDAGVDFTIYPMGKPFVGIKTLMVTSNAVDRGNAEVALDIIKYFTSADVQKNLALVNKTIPAQTAALADPEVAADPVLSAFGASLNIGVPMSNSPFASCQWGPVGDASLAVWNGSQAPDAAMAAAQAAIEECIAGMK